MYFPSGVTRHQSNETTTTGPCPSVSSTSVKQDTIQLIPQGVVQKRTSDWEKIMEAETGEEPEDWLYEEYSDLGLEVLKDN